MKEYISYLNENFDRKLINETNKKPLVNGSINKPLNCFWASPVDAKFGWSRWCENEHFVDTSKQIPTYLTVKEGSNIFAIESNKQFIKPESLNQILFTKHLENLIMDYSFLKEIGIDAVELEDSSIGHSFDNAYEETFNAWDCESICFLEPLKIVTKDEPGFEDSLKGECNRITSLSDYIDILISKNDVENLNKISKAMLLYKEQHELPGIDEKLKQMSNVKGVDVTLDTPIMPSDIDSEYTSQNIFEFTNDKLKEHDFKTLKKLCTIMNEKKQEARSDFIKGINRKDCNRTLNFCKSLNNKIRKDITNDIFSDIDEKDVTIKKHTFDIVATYKDYYLSSEVEDQSLYIEKNFEETNIEQIMANNEADAKLINSLLNKLVLDAQITNFLFYDCKEKEEVLNDINAKINANNKDISK